MKLNKAGFSLVELIVVILIIGVLAAVIAPSIIKYINEANEAIAKDTVMKIERAFDYALAETQLDFSQIHSDGSIIPHTLNNRPDTSLEMEKAFTKTLEETLPEELKGRYCIYIYPTRESLGDKSGKHIIYYTKGELVMGNPGYQYFNGVLTKGLLTMPSN